MNYKRCIAFWKNRKKRKREGREEVGKGESREGRERGREEEEGKEERWCILNHWSFRYKKYIICLATLIYTVVSDGFLEANKWLVNLKYTKLPVNMQLQWQYIKHHRVNGASLWFSACCHFHKDTYTTKGNVQVILEEYWRGSEQIYTAI